MRPVPHFVTLASGQIRIWRTGEGPLLLVLPGLLKGPVARTTEAALAFPDRTVVGVELPGLGGSVTNDSFTVARAASMMIEWVETLKGPVEILAFDLALSMALELQRASPRIGRFAWVGLENVLLWPQVEDPLDPLELADDGTHLMKLWGHLRKRDMVRPDDRQRARTDHSYLSAEDLDEALLCFGTDAAAYSKHWNYAIRACRDLEWKESATARGCNSVAEAADHLTGSHFHEARLFPVAERQKGRMVRDYVQVSRGRVHLRRAGDGSRLLLAFLAGAGSSINLEPLLTGLSGSRLVVAPDYIGQGDSCRNTAMTTVAELARDADEIASVLGFSSYDVYGTHTGAGVALEAAIAYPDRVGKVIIEGISLQDPAERGEHREKYFPVIEPDVWGSHVYKAWQVRRDGGYFWPWYRPEPASARTGRAPSLSLLHDRVISTLRSRTTPAYQAIASYAAGMRLPLLTQPGLFVAGPNDTFISHMDTARAIAPSNLRIERVPATTWFVGQDQTAVKATLQIFESFLDSTRTTG